MNDDPAQTKRVVTLFHDNQIFIAKSVVLETEWVLRGVYKLERKKVNAALIALLSLERLTLEDETALFSALDAHAQGLDFADALHLASSCRADSFATFDTSLRSRARKLNISPDILSP